MTVTVFAEVVAVAACAVFAVAGLVDNSFLFSPCAFFTFFLGLNNVASVLSVMTVAVFVVVIAVLVDNSSSSKYSSSTAVVVVMSAASSSSSSSCSSYEYSCVVVNSVSKAVVDAVLAVEALSESVLAVLFEFTQL